LQTIKEKAIKQNNNKKRIHRTLDRTLALAFSSDTMNENIKLKESLQYMESTVIYGINIFSNKEFHQFTRITSSKRALGSVFLLMDIGGINKPSYSRAHSRSARINSTCTRIDY
jgi:hypothetical protein